MALNFAKNALRSIHLLTSQQEPHTSVISNNDRIRSIRAAISAFEESVNKESDKSLKDVYLRMIHEFKKKFDQAVRSTEAPKALEKILIELSAQIETNETQYKSHSQIAAERADPLNKLWVMMSATSPDRRLKHIYSAAKTLGWSSILVGGKHLSLSHQLYINIRESDVRPPSYQMRFSEFYEKSFPGPLSWSTQEEADPTVEASFQAVCLNILKSAATNQEWLLEDFKPFDPEGLNTWKKKERGGLIGSGSHGQVYMVSVFDKSAIVPKGQAARTLAVKEIEIPDEETQFRLEARCFTMSQRAFRHPNLIEFVGYRLSPSKCEIFMEYVSGGTLEGLLKVVGSVTEKEMRSIIKQICKGLRHMHCLGLVHRDLKASNILATCAGCLKICDLDTVKDTSRKTTGDDQSVVGTPHWMAPEAAVACSSVRSDIWSLGCIIIEALTAKSPWCYYEQIERKDVLAKLRAMMETDNVSAPPIDTNWSSGLKQLLSEIFLPVDERIAVTGVLKSEWLKA